MSCCFHFITDDDATNGRWGDDALAVQASRPLFEALPFDVTVDYHGGLVGIEAWEWALQLRYGSAIGYLECGTSQQQRR